MLKILRERTKSLHWVLWLVIASFILLIFVQWGGAGSSRTDASQGAWAARVGERIVSVDEFRTRYQDVEAYYRRQLGANYQRGLFFQPEDILGGLVEDALLEEEARRLGLGAAATEVASAIRERPDLLGPDGRFNRVQYDRLLSYRGLRPREFEEREADRVGARKLTDLLRSGVSVSGQEVRQTWEERNLTASIELVLVPTSDFTGEVAVDEDALRSWYETRADDYDAGPGRRLRWVRFDRATVQQRLEDEAEMRRYYEENADLIYTLGPEQRRVSRLLVRVPPGADEGQRAAAAERAAGLAERARGRAEFAELVAAESDDETTRERGGDLGPFYRGTYGEAFDEAVFGAGEGEILGPVETARGFEVLLVTKGEGQVVRPFEEVRDLVARGLYATRAAEAVREAVAAFQGAYAESQDLDAAAEAAGTTASEPRWVTRRDAGGRDGPGAAAVARAFELGVGGLSDAISAPGGQVVVTVLEERESSPLDFDAAREAAEADYRQERAAELARSAAEALAGKATGELAEAAGDRTVRTATVRQRGAVTGVGLVPELNEAAMSLSLLVGEVGPVIEARDGAVVFRVTQRDAFDAEAFDRDSEGIREELRTARFQTLLQANLRRLRRERADEIEINDAVLAPLRSQPQSPLG